MEDDSQTVLDKAVEKVDIVPYTQRDKRLALVTLVVVCANLAVLLVEIVWGFV